MRSPLIHLPPRCTPSSLHEKLTTPEVGCVFSLTPWKPVALSLRFAGSSVRCSRSACANAASVPQPPKEPRRLGKSSPLCVRASARLVSDCSFRCSRKVARPAHVS